MRRRALGSFLLLLAVAVVGSAQAEAWQPKGQDEPKLELVMKIVVTCSSAEPMGPNAQSKDGERREIWPIIGGRFTGKDIKGTVIPGGGDFPVMRPDGTLIVDALYRLRTDDGVTIIIHNKGLGYGADKPEDWKFRLVPEFIAPQGKYDWLNKSVFLSTLVFPVPKELQLAKGQNENDRLIEIYRVL